MEIMRLEIDGGKSGAGDLDAGEVLFFIVSKAAALLLFRKKQICFHGLSLLCNPSITHGNLG